MPYHLLVSSDLGLLREIMMAWDFLVSTADMMATIFQPDWIFILNLSSDIHIK